MAERGGVVGALGKIGTTLDSEYDTFWVHATADVKGAALDPHDHKQVWFQ